MERVAVLDVGSSSIRASIVDETFSITASLSATLQVMRDGTANVTFDPMELLTTASTLLEKLSKAGSYDRIAITNQRASAVAFTRNRVQAVGPGISWEDLRTASQCLALAQRGATFAPNQSATKFTWLIDEFGSEYPDLMVGTIDTWLAFGLSQGASLATDATNAAMTGLVDTSGRQWDLAQLELLNLTPNRLAPIVDVVTDRGTYLSPHGSVPITVTIADQQASLAGQRPSAKVTLGTSAVADIELDERHPRFVRRGPSGTFPIVTDASAGQASFGIEAFWMNAGSAIAWLERNGLLTSATEAEAIAQRAERYAVPTVIPAHSGIGAPVWDFGGRCVIGDLVPDVGQPEIVHGFLLGIACAAADLVTAIANDSGQPLSSIGLDGKVGTNTIVNSALASLTSAPVIASPTAEATTLGAARLAFGLTKDTLPTGTVVEPGDRDFVRAYHERYHEHMELAKEALPALSKVSF
jgi:glycerol kinase